MPKIQKKNIKYRVMLELSDEHWQMLGFAKKYVQMDLEDLHLPKRFTDKQMIEAFIKQMPGIPLSLFEDYFVAHNPKWAAGFYAITNSDKYPQENRITHGQLP
jgi:hypothetical protein